MVEKRGRSGWFSSVTNQFYATEAAAKEAENAENSTDTGKNITRLKSQILAQGTTDKWSGQGFGSAEANAEDMAKILSGIGITDIRQFGKVDQLEPVEQIGFRLNGNIVQNPRPGLFYVQEPELDGEGGTYYRRRDLNAEEVKQIQPIYGVVTGADEYNQPTYAPVDSSTVTTKDGKLVGVTGQAFGNKVTGQAVPRTYDSDTTAWGGTYAGSGNTGYRAEFAPDGTPYFYTTGGSSKDKFLTTIAPMIAMALPFTGLAGGIGSALAGGSSAATQAAIGNAIIQGVMSEAQGGDFLKGAALSGAGSLATGLQPGLSEALGGGATGNIAADALIGGGISKLSGGDFATGALMGGIGSGINEAKLSAADEYLNSLPGGQGVYTDDLPDMSDFDLPPAVIDTSFTPDYSLSSGAPVIPNMGAQGIQAPTINEVVDVVNQPVDYSLPISVGSGFDLQMPTAPTDLGDPSSFINQPAPEVSVNIPELPAVTPKNIDTELGLLNAAQTLTPLVVGSLLANQALNKADDQPTGFEIVPIPGDWRSPEYNQTFTPSAAIDFGNLGMLAGTQFANPPASYSLSDVMNTLNMQPFMQQQFQTPFGMNDIVGEIDGTPMSLSSIIAGIQGQYGQET
jgi:hypothetical protein